MSRFTSQTDSEGTVARYQSFMDGCREYEKSVGGDPRACDRTEEERLAMNLNQPRLMQNYTHAGYAKVPTPAGVMKTLTDFWTHNMEWSWREYWNEGHTYVNHWDMRTRMLDIGRDDFPVVLSSKDKWQMIKEIQNVVESWTNQKVVLTSVYGIRIYREGAILASHVDRLPLVSSAIVNVVQYNVTEPWALEVIGHDGVAHNVTANPGEMILYESSSVIHGRPYPLQGEGSYYGSLFVHFEPLGHTLRHVHSEAAKRGDGGSTLEELHRSAKDAFEAALGAQQQMEQDSGTTDRPTASPWASRTVPRYVWPHYEQLYTQEQSVFEYDHRVYPKPTKVMFGKVNAHQVASLGDLAVLKELAKTDRNALFKADGNGWRPLHEAARSGHADVVEYLLEEGAQVNERTNNDKGGNALYWAEKDPTKNANAIAVLKRHGAVNLPPKDANIA